MDQVVTSFSPEKGSNKYIPIVKRAVPHSWYSNGTFKMKQVDEINVSFVKLFY